MALGHLVLLRLGRRISPSHAWQRILLICLVTISGATAASGDEINGRAAVFGWMAGEMASRKGSGDKLIVCIMDGEQALWEARDVFQEKVAMVNVLDLLRVTPR